VATAVDHRLVLRDAETLAVIFMQDCVAKIEHIEWSNDSDHVLCAMYKKGKVQCFRASDDEWRCEVDEGPAGVAFAKWSPCGTRVLCVTEFKLRLSVWSLLDATCVYVKSPKFDDGRGLDFSPDGKFLAFVRRDKRTDSVLVVDARDWTVASAFDVATEDLADARWSPDSTSIAVHDAPHANKGAMLYSPDGRLLGECEPDGDSKDPSNVKTNQAARVGVTRVRWSSGGSFLAAGGRDRRCRVVNHVSWRAFADLGHADRVVAPATVAVYEETEDARVEDGRRGGFPRRKRGRKRVARGECAAKRRPGRLRVGRVVGRRFGRRRIGFRCERPRACRRQAKTRARERRTRSEVRRARVAGVSAD
jgi:hypothetical protein